MTHKIRILISILFPHRDCNKDHAIGKDHAIDIGQSVLKSKKLDDYKDD